MLLFGGGFYQTPSRKIAAPFAADGFTRTRSGCSCPRVVVHSPGDGRPRLHNEPEKLVFETVGCSSLIRAVDQPIVQRQAVIDLISGAHSHVIEGKKLNQEARE